MRSSPGGAEFGADACGGWVDGGRPAARAARLRVRRRGGRRRRRARLGRAGRSPELSRRVRRLGQYHRRPRTGHAHQHQSQYSGHDWDAPPRATRLNAARHTAHAVHNITVSNNTSLAIGATTADHVSCITRMRAALVSAAPSRYPAPACTGPGHGATERSGHRRPRPRAEPCDTDDEQHRRDLQRPGPGEPRPTDHRRHRRGQHARSQRSRRSRRRQIRKGAVHVAFEVVRFHRHDSHRRSASRPRCMSVLTLPTDTPSSRAMSSQPCCSKWNSTSGTR